MRINLNFAKEGAKFSVQAEPLQFLLQAQAARVHKLNHHFLLLLICFFLQFFFFPFSSFFPSFVNSFSYFSILQAQAARVHKLNHHFLFNCFLISFFSFIPFYVSLSFPFSPIFPAVTTSQRRKPCSLFALLVYILISQEGESDVYLI